MLWLESQSVGLSEAQPNHSAVKIHTRRKYLHSDRRYKTIVATEVGAVVPLVGMLWRFVFMASGVVQVGLEAELACLAIQVSLCHRSGTVDGVSLRLKLGESWSVVKSISVAQSS